MFAHCWMKIGCAVAAWCVHATAPQPTAADQVAVEPATDSSQQASPDARDESVKGHPVCVADFFADEVWVKVAERTCVNCHREDGDVADTAFLLRDPARAGRSAQQETQHHNRAVFAAMAVRDAGLRPLLLVKATGGLDHGGGTVLEAQSTEYRILQRYIEQVRGGEANSDERATDAARLQNSEDDPGEYFDGVVMLDDRRLLRRIALSLVGRLPTPEELAGVEQRGMEAIEEILDQMMMEDAFYERLKEGFNDIFLTLGYDGVAENVLSYDQL